MAYDEGLAARVRESLGAHRGFSEKVMFGGICFLLNGHMTAGIVGSRLMLRVGPDGYQAALARPHVSEMDFTGRPLRGMIYVDPPGIAGRAALDRWLLQAVDFVESQPPKRGGPKPRPARPPRRTR